MFWLHHTGQNTSEAHCGPVWAHNTDDGVSWSTDGCLKQLGKLNDNQSFLYLLYRRIGNTALQLYRVSRYPGKVVTSGENRRWPRQKPKVLTRSPSTKLTGRTSVCFRYITEMYLQSLNSVFFFFFISWNVSVFCSVLSSTCYSTTLTWKHQTLVKIKGEDFS